MLKLEMNYLGIEIICLMLNNFIYNRKQIVNNLLWINMPILTAKILILI